jgi:trans-aconitate methyltransferase
MFQYDLYPYPGADVNTYAERAEYVTKFDPAPFARIRNTWPANTNFLVIGCGWSEATMMAKYPKINVVGIDLSNTSIMFATEIKEKHNMSNLTLINDDFITKEFDQKFSGITLTGVLHHMKEPEKALNKIHSLLSDNGVLAGMVYHNSRDFINEKYRFFQEIGWTDISNRAHINSIKNYLGSLPEADLCRQWFEFFNQSDAEIVDTWMHYHYRTYSEQELKELFNSCNLIVHSYVNNYQLVFVAQKIIGT